MTGLGLEFTEKTMIATYRNGGGMLLSASYANGEAELKDVSFSLSTDVPFFPEVVSRFDKVSPGEVIDLAETLVIEPDLDFIASLEVRTPAVVTLSLRDSEGTVLSSVTSRTEILPYNFWPGSSMPESIASFVTPNADQLAQIRSIASDVLSSWKMSPSLEGYQGDINRVNYVGAAVFSAIKRLGITYVNPPADFETVGQRVRLPSEVVEKREGTCIDLAVLYCSVLESIGLNTVMFIVRGHAFAGYWLIDDHNNDILSDDPAMFTRAIRNGELRAVECTLFVNGSNSQYNDAVAAGLTRLEDMESFCYAVDVAAARTTILPLPTRTLVEGRWVVDRAVNAEAAPAPIDVGKVYEDLEERKTTRVDRWKRELLDTGTRNSLISMKPGMKTIPLLVSDDENLVDSLTGGRDFTIYPKPQDWDGAKVYADRPFETELYMGTYAGASGQELSRGWIRTPLSEKETETYVRSVYRASVKELEESGCNALFVAAGILRWYEGKVGQPRYAPLILVPAELKKKNAGYTLRFIDEEVVFNVTLAELLRQEFEINIPGIDPLPTDDNGINVEQILQTVRRAIAGRDGWEVLKGAALGVFTFSQYAMWKDLGGNLEKLEENDVVRCLVEGTVMPGVQDIDVSADPYGLCLTVPADGSQIKAVRAAGMGMSFVMHGPPGTGKSQTITNIITDSLYLGKTVLFVAEKKAALEVVQNRLEKIGIGNHCLELHSNKTEKSKVLEQLRQSLESCKVVDDSKLPELMADIERQRASLDAYVTELHAPCSWGLSAYESISRYESFAGEKLPDVRVPEKYVMGLEPGTIGELSDRVARAVKTYAAVSDMDIPSMRAATVDETVLGLDDEIASALSKASAAETALASAVGQMSSVGLPVDFSDISGSAAAVSAVMDVPQEHAYDDDLPGTVNMLNNMFSAAGDISAALEGIDDIHSSASAFELEAAAIRAEPLARDLSAHGYRPAAVSSMIAGAKEAAQTRKGIENDVRGILSVWKDSVFDADSRIGISAGYDAASKAGFFAKKKARQEFMNKVLPLLRNPNTTFESLSGTAPIVTSTANEVLRISNAVSRARTACGEVQLTARQKSEGLAATIRSLGAAGLEASKLPLLRSKLESARSQTDSFMNAMEAFRTAAQALSARTACTLDLTDPAVFRTFRDDITPFRGRFFDWAAWNICVKWFAERDMDQVVDMVRSGVSGWTAGAAAEKGMYKTMFGISRQRSEVLRLFSSDSFEADIERFRKLDAKYTAYNRNLLKYKLYERTPRDLDSSVSGTEAAVLYRAINSTRMRKSIRQLLSEIPNLLPDICPCLLMSPQSVAQYITHDFPKFDIVIFDESSQIVTAKAIGALGRAKCAVVAGDNKQLPPTSFFQKKIEGGDDDAIDVESFLDDCLGVRMPETYLEWHYRSRHESLIGFSNRMFYGNRMLTFPSPNDSATKVSCVKVAGVYERGRRCNEAEARAVAEEVRRRVMDGSGMSVGVIAFSISQQTAIEDMIDDMEADDRAFSKALDSMPEPIFVKNLETVQGDERDVILFSIGYGPGKDGTVFQNFGPINRAGGGRRLNVAVSRARREMVVFSSMSHADIKVTPASSSGVRSMREFLRYAENGGRFGNEPGAELRAGDSSILAEVADALAAKGYECRFGIGASEFRVDVAVVDPDDPDRYILGILSDGESYKASENTRDREYARSDVLRGLGWEVAHVWSVEWYFRRERVMQNLTSLLDRIIARRDSGEAEKPAEEEADVSDFGTVDAPKSTLAAAPGMNRKAVYLPFDTSNLPVPEDPFARPAVLYAARAIIKVESPVSEANLLKEYCRVSGIRRLTSQKREALLEILEKEFGPAKRGTFVTYWAKDANPDRYDMFRVSSDPAAMRDIDSIPLPEILSAIADAVERFGSFEVEAAPRVIASQFGFSRSGDRIREVVGEAMVFALEDGIVVKDNGRYRQP